MAVGSVVLPLAAWYGRWQRGMAVGSVVWPLAISNKTLFFPSFF